MNWNNFEKGSPHTSGLYLVALHDAAEGELEFDVLHYDAVTSSWGEHANYLDLAYWLYPALPTLIERVNEL